MLLVSTQTGTTTTEARALPLVPPTARPHLEAPSHTARSTVEDHRHSDMHSIFDGRRGSNGGTAESSIEEYTDIRRVFGGRDGGGRTSYRRPISVDDSYHYIDIDRLTNQSGSGNQTVSLHDYEGLGPSVSPVLRQPQRPRNYVRLGALQAGDAGSGQTAAEHAQMSQSDAANWSRNAVSPSF